MHCLASLQNNGELSQLGTIHWEQGWVAAFLREAFKQLAASTLVFFVPCWEHNNSLGKSEASESRVLSAPSSVWLWQYGVGCHLSHSLQSSLQLSQTMGHSEGSKGSIETERTLPAAVLCALFSLPSMVFQSKNELWVMKEEEPSVEEKTPWCMYWERRSSLKRKAGSRRVYGVWVWGPTSRGTSQGRVFLTVCKLLIFSTLLNWRCGGVPGVFSVSSTNTMKSLSHESHPSCVCCHTTPAYLCLFV